MELFTEKIQAKKLRKFREDLWLVNGAEGPSLTMKATEWHRLRLVMAGVSTWLYLSFGSCEVTWSWKTKGWEIFKLSFWWLEVWEL